ncbi:MAG: GNAT family N-acetyltransferase [Christensenellales bacterium]|jgi:GNAT superfamily N-acetyltransferase
MAVVREIDGKSRKELKQFIKFANKHYQKNKFFVSQLLSDQIKTLSGINNPLFDNGVYAFFMAFEEDVPVGRICVGIDEKLNTLRNKKQGWFTLFECVDDADTAALLFEAAAAWLRERGVTTMIGPVSPTNGDDSKGVLVQGFDGPPVLLNSYNYQYYHDLYTGWGFEKDEDHLAFLFHPETINAERYGATIDRIMQRNRFKIDRLDISPKNREKEARDIKQILDEGMSEDWEYTTPPSLKAITDEMSNLGSFYSNRYCFVARTYEGRPVGFCLALPDFNQVLIKMKGRLLPLGWLKFLIYRKKINGIRGFVQFVSMDYQQRGVSAALLRAVIDDFIETGIAFGEASTIGEYNARSIATMERAGGKLYRVYRVFRKAV